MRKKIGPAAAVALAAAFLALVAACGGGGDEAKLRGTIDIDGSSTVYPITEAVAEEFGKSQPSVKVTVGISGTGGGFKRFCNGETAISDASRPISKSEIDACAAKAIEYIEIPVAYDALSVVVHPQNDWATCITVAELKTLWDAPAQGTITKWSQVNSKWPDATIKLFGPGPDSGTFDYFTEHVNGKAKQSRGDYTPSEDDNVLVTGVAGDKNALGYFGLAYYLENKGKIKALTVDQGKGGGCVAPSAATVENGTYPLARPLFIYVKKSEAEKPEVKAFVDFYIKSAAELSADVGYVKFPERIYALVKARWEKRTVGTMYASAAAGASIEQLLSPAQ